VPGAGRGATPDAEAKSLLDELPGKLVEGYLYRRILRRIDNEVLREVAAWLMVPRRLVEPLVGELLIELGSSATAGSTFAALSGEATLLETEGSALALRPDLRNTLLQLLREENAERLVALDRVCAKFWADRAKTDIAAAGEAVYHHLRLEEVASAETYWRDGVEGYLRGYAVDEIPEASRAWLQLQLAGKGTEDRVEDLLARGRLGDAREALADQPRQTKAASRSARRRRLLGFVEVSPDFDEDLSGLESLVLTKQRPAFRVSNGSFASVASPWELLEDCRDCIERAIAATGQLRTLEGTVLGSAVLVGPRLFATTRAAAASFVVGSGRDVRKIGDRHVEIDLRAEGTGGGERYGVARAVLVHPHWDLALLEVADDVPHKPLALATNPPESGRAFIAIGHPGEVASNLAHLRRSVYGDVVDVKRVMPGRFTGTNQTLTFGHSVVAGTDDASTLSADPGAAVIDPETGALVGVRFATEYLSGNHFVPAWELVRDPAIVEAGVRIVGTPGKSPPWTVASSTTLPRQQLLDAYVAWQEHHTSRTLAILSLVPDDARDLADRTNRALLQIACRMRGSEHDRQHVGPAIETLLAGPAALSVADTEDLVATRLRYAVDAEAEATLLKVSVQSDDVSYVRRHFRVLVGPPATPLWLPRSGTLVDLLALASRVTGADAACRNLASWALKHGKRLLDLDFDDVSRDQARARAAALVAFPKELAHRPNTYLLSKLDLEPHPTLGWKPVLEPLRAYLATTGFTEDLEPWLENQARSGRLGAYLDERIRLETDIAWAAGLLHLLTPLPFDALLARRFATQS
jgi:hypothetical protein